MTSPPAGNDPPQFEIALAGADEIRLAGRLDALHSEEAHAFFARMDPPRLIDLTRLEFIASAGLGVLLVVQKRATRAGATITLANANANIRNVFRHAGFERLFRIVDASA
jgi:anti-anti-sigma factor